MYTPLTATQLLAIHGELLCVRCARLVRPEMRHYREADVGACPHCGGISFDRPPKQDEPMPTPDPATPTIRAMQCAPPWEGRGGK